MADDTSIVLGGSWETELPSLVKNALELALQEQKLPTAITDIVGMSGIRYRNFINNLIKSLDNPRYLEIGSWAGSTACSAIYNNKLLITCIDNWSEFGGPKNDFFTNVNANSNKDTNFSFIESDFRTVDYSSIGKYNIYLFDGPHEYEDQKDGIVIAQNALDDTYILIVDDYNWVKVRNGTIDAINELNQLIVASVEIRTTDDNSHSYMHGKHSDWHNGYFIAVISKNT